MDINTMRERIEDNLTELHERVRAHEAREESGRGLRGAAAEVWADRHWRVMCECMALCEAYLDARLENQTTRYPGGEVLEAEWGRASAVLVFESIGECGPAAPWYRLEVYETDGEGYGWTREVHSGAIWDVSELDEIINHVNGDEEE